MAKIIFKCLQCGRCCKSLFREIDKALVGLSLFPDERKLFSKEFVSPHAGIGWGLSGPKYIINYQLNASACPHLSKDNLCRIYDKRPFTCQAFPLIWVGLAEPTIAGPGECTFMKRVEREVGSLDSILPMTPKKFKGSKEWQAIRKINSQTRKFFEDHLIDAQVLWVFDLRNKEWQILQA